MALTSITELTEGTLTGNGAFDKLMAAGRVHLDAEYKLQRLRGPEYAQVYVGMIESAMQGGMNWIIQGARIDLERELLAQQVEMAKIQKLIADVQLLKVGVELEMLNLQKPKIIAEVALIQAQVVQIEAENLLIPKKILLMDAEVLYKQKQGEMIISEIANNTKQGLLITAQVAKANQDVLNSQAEALNIPKQGLLLTAQKSQIDQQVLNMASEKLGIEQRTLLAVNQTANEITQGLVLEAQKCKLQAEFNLIMNQISKSTSEVALLVQKTMTERAQTQALGVDADSVIGRQKELYLAQKDGYKRDAEQKAAKLLIDTWNARRVSDPATVADATNKLDDFTVGAFVQLLKTGVGA